MPEQLSLASLCPVLMYLLSVSLSTCQSQTVLACAKVFVNEGRPSLLKCCHDVCLTPSSEHVQELSAYVLACSVYNVSGLSVALVSDVLWGCLLMPLNAHCENFNNQQLLCCNFCFSIRIWYFARPPSALLVSVPAIQSHVAIACPGAHACIFPAPSNQRCPRCCCSV